jgi:hypothetical protein
MNAEIVARIEESLSAELGVATVKVDMLASRQELLLAAERLEMLAGVVRWQARVSDDSPGEPSQEAIERLKIAAKKALGP